MSAVEVDVFTSGFVTLVGRPNVGKSTLINQLVGSKVSIVSNRPNTTRTEVRGVVNRPRSQTVFLDTPGIHKPRTELGERTNTRALSTLGEVDVIVFLVDASGAIGSGDRFIADRLRSVSTPKILAVNKVDLVDSARIARHLASASTVLGDFEAFVPLSARTGDGTDALLGEIASRLKEGPQYYPDGVVTDCPENFIAAELVREQLLKVARDELPHSITVIVERIEDPDGDDDPDAHHDVDHDEGAHPELLRLRAVILVERESQKGMVIGHRGEVLKVAGTAARLEMEALFGCKVFLETRVKVERDWQRRAHMLDRLGF